MKVEIARESETGKLMGWRLTADHETLLVWHDDPVMKGFRVGAEFPYNPKGVTYKTIDVSEKGNRK